MSQKKTMKFLIVVKTTTLDTERFMDVYGFLTDEKRFAVKFDSYEEAENFVKSIKRQNYKIVEG